MDAKEKPLSVRNTLEYLDCSKSHLYYLIRSGKIKPKYLGKKPYFSVSQIQEAMSEHPESLVKKGAING
jgi:YHS domain-containing protein